MPSAYALHLLGVIWFTALLTNSRQDVLQVERAIERARDRVLQDGSIIPDELVRDSTFLPENVFWHPAAFQPADDWGSLWEEALSLGWSLFLVSGEVKERIPGKNSLKQSMSCGLRSKASCSPTLLRNRRLPGCRKGKPFMAFFPAS